MVFRPRALPLFLHLALAFAGTTAATVQGAPPAPDIAVDTSPTALAKLSADLDAERVKAAIPGMALVVVSGDRVVLIKGFGDRDVARKQPVTPDTLFAIGSSTKAFTALAVMMAADDGKLSLADSPKKYLPYFHLRDPDADSRITLRDLMCHRSGLARTDLAMITGALSRQELIQVVGLAKPTAKLGEKFQYQNIMFAAAGESVAQAEKTPYETLVMQRIFKPLGMSHTTFSVPDMLRSPDHAVPYQVTPDSHTVKPLPQRDIEATAPAGAIESSAGDMANWLRFMLQGDGAYNGKRLVSSANFAELTKPQMTIGGTTSYGLGWFLEDWQGNKVVEHGGNIDGFTTAVGLMPGRKLGFALLINDNAAVLGPASLGMVWSHLVPTAVAPPDTAATQTAASAATIDAGSLAGDYSSQKPPISMNIARGADGVMSLVVAGQPAYPLQVVSGNRYKLGAPAPEGFFVTFRPTATPVAGIQMFLEQPQGNLTLTRDPVNTAADLPAAQRDLVGDYDKDGRTLTLTGRAGKLTVLVPGQPPYPLEPAGDPDTFVSPALPHGFTFHIQRDPATHLPTALLAHQPNIDTLLTRVAGADLPTADDLLAKMVAAYGGADNLRRHKSSITEGVVDFENQGVTGTVTEWAQAPDSQASHITLTALGKQIGTIEQACDGKAVVTSGSFVPTNVREGKALAAARRAAAFTDAFLDAHDYDVKIEVKRRVAIEGEDAFVLVETPKGGGPPLTSFVSARTYLLLRRDQIDPDSGIPRTTSYYDYRAVDGVQIPFRTTESDPGNGTVTTALRTVRFDAPLPPGVFEAPGAPK